MDTNDEVDESPCLNLLLSIIIIIITQGWSCFLCTVHYIYGGLFSLSSTAMVLETFTRRCLAVCHVILTIPFFPSFLACFFPLFACLPVVWFTTSFSSFEFYTNFSEDKQKALSEHIFIQGGTIDRIRFYLV